jgi:hypothetical protein
MHCLKMSASRCQSVTLNSGNILNCLGIKTNAEAIAQGRNSNLSPQQMERTNNRNQPTGTSGGTLFGMRQGSFV